METNHTATEKEISNFVFHLVPFGYLDIKSAIEAAIESGHDEDWAAEQVTNFMDDTNIKIEDIDPVYCVYDAILQEARNEIEQETGFDFLNDGAEVSTYGNFMCTSYDYEEESKKLLIERLAEKEIQIEDLSENTKWFLSQIEIEQSDIEAAKEGQE